MKLLLRNLLLGASLLIGCTSICCAQYRNPYDAELEQHNSALNSADTLHKLVLLDLIFELRDYTSDPEAVPRIFRTTAQQVETAGKNRVIEEDDDALLHSEAQAYLNDLNRSTVMLTAARHWYQEEETRRHVLARVGSPATAAGLQLRAELEHLAGLAEAAEHMRQAAQLEPTALRWREAATYTTDPLNKYSALEAGLALKQDDPGLNLQAAIYYVGREQLEKAQSMLSRALLAAPDDFVLALHLAELHMHLGLRSSALEEFKSLESRWARPLWVQERLASDYEQLGLIEEAVRFANQVLQIKSGDRPLLELLARFHQRRHLPRELENDYVRLSALQPESAQLWSKLTQLQIAREDWTAARASLLHLVTIDPANSDAHLELARVYERLHLEEAARKEAAEASRIVRPETGKLPLDSSLLSNPQELAEAAFRRPPDEEDIALSDVRIQELYDEGLNRVHVQQVFYIGSDAAAENHRIANIRYSPALEDVRVIHARIWKPGGAVLEAQELGESAVANGPQAMYYDMRSRQLRFTGLEKGDVAELDYSLAPTIRQNPYKGYFGELVILGGRLPTRLRRYALVLPSGQSIFVHAEKVAAARVNDQDGRRTMVWELREVPALPREAGSPGITELSPYVHVSTMADWQQLGAWYAELIRPQFALDGVLRQQLDRLMAGTHSDQEKIAAIQEFVLRSTHYVALEFGIYSYKPYPVAETYARRFGDCKDKASLMIALLRAAGIEADLALVRTRSMGDVVPTPASVAIFDHAIVYIPKYDLWLDGTAEYSGRELPLADQGALALTVSLNGQAQLRQVPVSSASDNYTRRTIYAELAPDGLIHFSGSTVTRGEDAPGLRRALAVPEQQLDLFRQRLAEVFPSVEIDNVAVHGTQNLADDVSVDFQGALNSFEHQPLVRLGSSWMPRAYLSGLAATSTRTQDLVLSAPWTTEEEIHIALPEAATVRELPGNKEITTSFGAMRLRYSASAREVVIRSRLEFQKTRISARDYSAFREFCAGVERSFRSEIVVGLSR